VRDRVLADHGGTSRAKGGNPRPRPGPAARPCFQGDPARTELCGTRGCQAQAPLDVRGLKVWPSRYLWVSSSSISATVSTIFSRCVRAASTRSAGISIVSDSRPGPRPDRRSPSWRSGPRRRGTSPRSRSGAGSARAAPEALADHVHAAPEVGAVRSSLLMKQMRGTRYRSAGARRFRTGAPHGHAVEDHDAPSSTRRLRSTSTVKSTCPGVSMMLIR